MTSRRFLHSLDQTKTNYRYSYIGNGQNADSTNRADFRTPQQLGGFRDRSAPNAIFSRPNIVWGDDHPDKVTTYNMNHCDSRARIVPDTRTRRVSSPLCAEILPYSGQRSMSGHCTGRTEYSHLGHYLSRQIYTNRRADLDCVRHTHTTDSVAASQIGPQRKMMTRFMIDYNQPIVNEGNIKTTMTQSISPYVREDNIWKSVGGRQGKCPSKSSTTSSYIWLPQRLPRHNRQAPVR